MSEEKVYCLPTCEWERLQPASRPQLLDLFCGAGGCSVGYDRAGFDVSGVDIDADPAYPFSVFVRDALDVLDNENLSEYAAIHASPPCQAYTTMSNRWRGGGGATDSHPRLIAEVRGRLEAIGKPYVIENVPGARSEMRNPVTLHGGMFGLGVYRPRLFEAPWLLWGPTPAKPPSNPLGVYGRAHDGRRLFTRTDGTEQRAAASLEEAQQAMGIDWMGWDGLREAVPPAYTEWIGQQLLSVVTPGTGMTGRTKPSARVLGGVPTPPPRSSQPEAVRTGLERLDAQLRAIREEADRAITTRSLPRRRSVR